MRKSLGVTMKHVVVDELDVEALPLPGDPNVVGVVGDEDHGGRAGDGDAVQEVHFLAGDEDAREEEDDDESRDEPHRARRDPGEDGRGQKDAIDDVAVGSFPEAQEDGEPRSADRTEFEEQALGPQAHEDAPVEAQHHRHDDEQERRAGVGRPPQRVSGERHGQHAHDGEYYGDKVNRRNAL